MKSLFRLILVLAITSLSHGALAQGMPQVPPDLSAPEARQLQESGKLLLVDVRTPQEWRQTGVAEGVMRLNMRHPGGGDGFIEDLLRQVDGDRNAPIGLICRTGNRTTHLQRYLVAQGFTQVYNVKEGMAGSAAGPGWLRRGLPTDPCRSC